MLFLRVLFIGLVLISHGKLGLHDGAGGVCACAYSILIQSQPISIISHLSISYLLSHLSFHHYVDLDLFVRLPNPTLLHSDSLCAVSIGISTGCGKRRLWYPGSCPNPVFFFLHRHSTTMSHSPQCTTFNIMFIQIINRDSEKSPEI